MNLVLFMKTCLLSLWNSLQNVFCLISNVISATTYIYIRQFTLMKLRSSINHSRLSNYHLCKILLANTNKHILYSKSLFLPFSPQKYNFFKKKNHKVVKIIYSFPKRNLNANMISFAKANGSSE